MKRYRRVGQTKLLIERLSFTPLLGTKRKTELSRHERNYSKGDQRNS
jgi:hypothetical protein